MTYRTRKRLALLVLVVGLPLWLALSAVVVSAFDRPHWAVELAVYTVLGIAWALPFRALFRGLGREDPDGRPPGGAD